jgi:hypothetical protein
VGNKTSWNTYTLLGYRVYDNCFQFDTQWKKMQENKGDALQFIWFVYMYHINRSLELPATLDRWADDIAKPYLETNRPNILNANTDDPRKARRHYDESDLMETDEQEEKSQQRKNGKLSGRKRILR